MAKPLKFQIIEKAKELIQDERRWCRGYLAMDASRTQPIRLAPWP